MCTDSNCILEKGAILASKMHCVKLLIKGRVLFVGMTVTEL
jgi:hypothetical protein